MHHGTAVDRQWVVTLHNGTIVVDWSEGMFLDVMNGTYLHASEGEISHRAQDAELDWLRRAGRVESFDEKKVYFINLPDQPFKTLD